MANKLIKWKPGKTGLYAAHVMDREDWERMGFKGDDAKKVEFSRKNNFTIVADDLPFAQMDFFESTKENYEVKEAPAAEPTPSPPSQSAATPTPAPRTAPKTSGS